MLREESKRPMGSDQWPENLFHHRGHRGSQWNIDPPNCIGLLSVAGSLAAASPPLRMTSLEITLLLLKSPFFFRSLFTPLPCGKSEVSLTFTVPEDDSPETLCWLYVAGRDAGQTNGSTSDYAP
jgi:hypothetical protein